MHGNQRYWVAVVDGGQARIFKRDGKFASLQQIDHFNHPNEQTQAHGSDKPGRVFESAVSARHAYEPKHDWHDQQKHLFVQEIGNHIVKAYQDKQFDRLVLICPAHLLADLRKSVAAHMAEEELRVVAKDLTHHSLENIQKFVDEIV